MSSLAYAQVPVISKVERLQTYPLDTLLITGSGFGTNAAVLQVWFDHVKGTITGVSDFSIKVVAPIQAKLHNVTVINTSSGLQATSLKKFIPSFNGETFSAAKFSSQTISNNTPSVFDLCGCDLDGDGKTDLMGSRNDGGTDIVVLHNKSTPGTVTFDRYDKASMGTLALNQPTQHITCGDLNGDGKPDVVAGRAGGGANSVYVFKNLTNITGATTQPSLEAPQQLFMDGGDISRQISINDLNSDGKPELIVANSADDKIVYVFQNTSSGGNLTFNATPLKLNMGAGVNSLALEVQDFDGDGRQDIIASQNQTANLFFLKNQSTSSISFADAVTITTSGTTINDVNSADFNGDGKLDLVVTSIFGNEISVLMNKTTGSTVSFSTVAEQLKFATAAGSRPFGVEVSDVNGDGFTDIVAFNRDVASINVLIHNQNNTTPNFTATTITTTGKNGWFGRVSDFDSDGKPDIAVTQAVSLGIPNTISLLRNTHCHQPAILTEGPLSICPGQTIRLEAIPNPAVTYEWRRNDIVVQAAGPNAFFDATLDGSYTVRAIGEGGACSLMSTAFPLASGTGSVPNDAIISAIPQACVGDDLTITANNVPGATYLWSGPNDFSTSITNSNLLVVQDITTDQAGLYSLRLRINECTGKEDTQEARVVEVGSFNVGSSASGPVCEGEDVTLSVNPSAGRTYQWIKDGNDLGTQTAATLSLTSITNANEGSYTMRVSFSGCSKVTAPQVVTVRTPPTVSFTADAQVCTGVELDFDNTSTVDPDATVTYAWDFGDGTTSTLESPTHTYTAAPTSDPSLTISYTNIAACTREVSQAIEVSTPQNPVITASANEICPAGEETLSIPVGYTSVLWNLSQTTNEITIAQPGTYSVTALDENACEVEASVVITEKLICGFVEIAVPKFFSPNGDTQNDRWVITGVDDVTACSIKIFDERGRIVVEKGSFEPAGWDGTASGKSVPQGVYYYVLTCPGVKAITGSVLVIK